MCWRWSSRLTQLSVLEKHHKHIQAELDNRNNGYRLHLCHYRRRVRHLGQLTTGSFRRYGGWTPVFYALVPRRDCCSAGWCRLWSGKWIHSSKIHIPPIIATLGTMTIIKRIVYMYTGGYPLYVDSERFTFIGNGYIGPIPFHNNSAADSGSSRSVHSCQDEIRSILLCHWRQQRGGQTLRNQSRLLHDLTFVAGGVMAAMSGIVYASRLLSVTPLWPGL